MFLTLLLLASVTTVGAQGTAFTYQGRLQEGGNAVNGNYDLRFTIYDSANSPGVAVAGPETVSSVAVSNGLFTVTLDFGDVFNGADRWLEIGIRPTGAQDFTVLSPRQPITATPYANYAAKAGALPSGAVTAAQLAPGAAAANLEASGQSGVTRGGVVLSPLANAVDLTAAGYQKMGRAELIDEAWLARASGPSGLPPALARQGHSAVWTGSELIIWGGTDSDGNLLNTGARYNPTAGTWTPIATSNAPSARTGHSAVWTGSEMIIWGGRTYSLFGGISATNTGARYNPATDVWTPIAPGGGSRQNHSAFWTGTEMLVWGGTVDGGGLFGTSQVPINSGARYNLAGNSWTAISTTGTPSARQDYSAVFTGTEMIIWGGRASLGSFITTLTNYNDGARYSLAANTWTPVSLTGAPFRRYNHSAVWSGTDMIVWGGQYAEGSLGVVSSNYNNGARYNPAANTWSPVSTTGAPEARFDHDAVWAGDRMVIWGGTDGTNLLASGARYFPGLNTWSNMTTTAQPIPRTGDTALWADSEMIVWGGFNEFLRDIGGRYNPQTDVWTLTPPSGERAQRRGHTAVWTGDEVIVWGGFDGERYLNTGGRYLPASDLWLPVTTNGAPTGRMLHSAVWTGTEMIIWGGIGPNALNTGARYNPATDHWTTMTTSDAPTARSGQVAVWTGSQMIVWGGENGAFVNTGARYNPANNTWTATATNGAPTARSSAVSVWDASEMLVWGGEGGTIGSPSVVATGGRYDPMANAWAALPTANAPVARTDARAVWSGDEMLVWGGTDLSEELNTGGRYNRTVNSWSAISTNNAPSPRADFTAVWDGARMIIWGGRASENFLADGGLYDPSTDGWLNTVASTNTPAARASQVAVWTGTEMVVHGGYGANAPNGGEVYFDDTWHYIPPRTMFLYLKP